MKILKILSYSNASSRIILRNRMIRPMSTVDSKEIEHLSSLKDDWWNKKGMLASLHSYTPFKVQFVRNGLNIAGYKPQNLALPLEGLKIADIGCGGGLVTEPLARIGARVTGIDASADLIDVAKEHAKLDPDILKRVDYIQTTVEELSKSNEESYDAVVASDVLEHVADPELFLKECVKIVKPGGSIFITTISKTLKSWLVAIVLAEYITKFIPRGTHEWRKFITPHEVQTIFDKYGCKTKLICGWKANQFTNRWSSSSSTAVSYGLHAVKQKESNT